MMRDVEAGGLVFNSSFDSGNATRVEAVADAEHEFRLWTRRDCEGQPGENGCKTWFSFSVKGAVAGTTLAFRIHGMNSQGNLFRHDMRPCYRALPSKPEWDRLPLPTSHWGGKAADKYREMRENRGYVSDADEFVLRFEHLVETPGEDTLYFAFCYPVSYTETIARLAWLDAAFGLPPAPVQAPPPLTKCLHDCLRGCASFIESAFPTKVEYEAWRKAQLSAEATGASTEPAAAALTAALATTARAGGEGDNRAVTCGGGGASAEDVEIAEAAVALAASLAPGAPPDRSEIYYHRELLTRCPSTVPSTVTYR